MMFGNLEEEMGKINIPDGVLRQELQHDDRLQPPKVIDSQKETLDHGQIRP